MRQVPQYLIIGNGRLARHLCHYFSHSNIQNYHQWHRAMPLDLLQSWKKDASHILVAIKDSAIEPFIDEYLKDTTAVKVHFSGSLVSKKAWGAHPLMTFGPELYSLEKYLSIPFVVDKSAPDFQTLLPGLRNPHVRIYEKQKAKYHALCVMAGNFSCLLWQKLFFALENEFGIPAHTADTFLRQQSENILTDPHNALTGPLARGDRETIERNIKALAGDPFQLVYTAFSEAYPQISQENEKRRKKA